MVLVGIGARPPCRYRPDLRVRCTSRAAHPVLSSTTVPTARRMGPSLHRHTRAEHIFQGSGLMIVPSILLALAALQTTAAPAATAEHVAIQAADIDRSAAFYHEAFGLRIIPTPLKNRRWLDLGNGLALHILDGRTAPKPLNRNEHLALHVDDLATVIAWLDQHGRVWTDLAGTPRARERAAGRTSGRVRSRGTGVQSRRGVVRRRKNPLLACGHPAGSCRLARRRRAGPGG